MDNISPSLASQSVKRDPIKHSAEKSDEGKGEPSVHKGWEYRDLGQGRSAYFLAGEEGDIPKVKEIVLSPTSPQSKSGLCLYEEMWSLDNRSNTVVVGYVDSIPDSEGAKNTAMGREQTRRPCPSAIMINYRPLLALLERVLGIDKMPTPCL